MKELTECLVCGNEDLRVFCDMGPMPLVNNLKNSPEEKDIVFPLVVNQCPTCTHKQLSISVDRELMFKDYLYKTGTSYKHRQFFSEFAHQLSGKDAWIKRTCVNKNILDIGSNDGSLLYLFYLLRWNCLGVEPCKELTKDTVVPVINDFFPTKITKRFDVITAFNVFAHNDNPKEFLIAMADLLKPEGRIYIITTPDRLDNFYHEHISYFTPKSMITLAEECGVEVVSFKEVPMHGKSYLFEIKEKQVQLKSNTYIGECVAYGASASETVLFNYYKIKPEYVVDDNVLKQGKFIPGVNSPVVSCGTLEKDERELTIIVAHNLFDEIKEKIKKLRPNKKDKFVRLT